MCYIQSSRNTLSYSGVYSDQVIHQWEGKTQPFVFTHLPLSLSIFRFFEDLERRHYDNPVIRDISDIVQNHATHHFEPYIVYCSNETFQQRTLQKLLWVAAVKCKKVSAVTQQDELNVFFFVSVC